MPFDEKQTQPDESARSLQVGPLSCLVVIPSIAEAHEYKRSVKWALTILVSLGALSAPLGSNILLPVLFPIAEYFQASHTVVNLSIALYALAVAITPLWWSHLAETQGRRAVYLVTFFLSIVFCVLGAVSTSIGMFVAMRLLAGGACASVQSVGAGTVADLWQPQERGKAMGIFSLGPMLGPLAAPIIGAAITTRWDWRATQWFLVIYCFVVWMAMIFLLPETSTKFKTSKQAAAKTSKEAAAAAAQDASTTANRLSQVVVSPILSVKLLRYVPILIIVSYTSVTFASNYLLNISIQDTLSQAPYEWTTMIIGLAYVPSSVGAAVGALLGGRWTDHCLKRGARKAGRADENGKPIFRPEDRISENFWVAAVMYPAALLWWGWAAEKHAFWVVPLLANFFFGFAFMLISSVSTTVMTEFVPGKTTTGVAVLNLVRNTLGCVAAIVADPLIKAIGNGWLFTIAFFICLGCGGGMVLMKRNWNRWKKEMTEVREQSK